MLFQTKISARVTFYFGAAAMAFSALSVNMPEWHAMGVTPLGFLQGADTWFLMCIAILLSDVATALREQKS